MKILAYREDWGGEIRSKRWLKQFSNREIEDVQAISGATISVNSLKTDISKLKSEKYKISSYSRVKQKDNHITNGHKPDNDGRVYIRILEQNCGAIL